MALCEAFTGKHDDDMAVTLPSSCGLILRRNERTRPFIEGRSAEYFAPVWEVRMKPPCRAIWKAGEPDLLQPFAGPHRREAGELSVSL